MVKIALTPFRMRLTGCEHKVIQDPKTTEPTSIKLKRMKMGREGWLSRLGLDETCCYECCKTTKKCARYDNIGEIPLVGRSVLWMEEEQEIFVVARRRPHKISLGR